MSNSNESPPSTPGEEQSLSPADELAELRRRLDAADRRIAELSRIAQRIGDLSLSSASRVEKLTASVDRLASEMSFVRQALDELDRNGSGWKGAFNEVARQVAAIETAIQAIGRSANEAAFASRRAEEAADEARHATGPHHLIPAEKERDPWYMRLAQEYLKAPPRQQLGLVALVFVVLGGAVVIVLGGGLVAIVNAIRGHVP